MNAAHKQNLTTDEQQMTLIRTDFCKNWRLGLNYTVCCGKASHQPPGRLARRAGMQQAQENFQATADLSGLERSDNDEATYGPPFPADSRAH